MGDLGVVVGVGSMEGLGVMRGLGLLGGVGIVGGRFGSRERSGMYGLHQKHGTEVCSQLFTPYAFSCTRSQFKFIYLFIIIYLTTHRKYMRVQSLWDRQL